MAVAVRQIVPALLALTLLTGSASAADGGAPGRHQPARDCACCARPSAERECSCCKPPAVQQETSSHAPRAPLCLCRPETPPVSPTRPAESRSHGQTAAGVTGWAAADSSDQHTLVSATAEWLLRHVAPSPPARVLYFVWLT